MPRGAVVTRVSDRVMQVRVTYAVSENIVERWHCREKWLLGVVSVTRITN